MLILLLVAYFVMLLLLIRVLFIAFVIHYTNVTRPCCCNSEYLNKGKKEKMTEERYTLIKMTSSFVHSHWENSRLTLQLYQDFMRFEAHFLAIKLAAPKVSTS